MVRPLPHEWMVASIIGFFVSWLTIYANIGATYPLARKFGAAFMLIFLLVFIATVVNMSQATTEEEHLRELAIHEKR